ncbi:hypothetical protein C5B42_04300 [Candidatus Cerribacteria bacterium 'Amazon FNV 2010 28 9']|uniref:Uncharacterized protein n=1 Tax=Candidatus Cerribacteria bacterium 'Amazon FNV 2010 28 9' TaxID=2081795 RepID=A0A317JNL0_9BACT|nr:MAG: hypothetical protein C5B42_04300 [Candidatus Cerribacteria bacterium 'Amazon FNV 2010 28 9']
MAETESVGTASHEILNNKDYATRMANDAIAMKLTVTGGQAQEQAMGATDSKWVVEVTGPMNVVKTWYDKWDNHIERQTRW